MGAEPAKFESFEEFWPYYVAAHRHPACRALHYLGTSLALGCVATGVLTLTPLWFAVAPVVGYGPAWIGHYFLEGNQPATLSHPWYSLRGDARMLGLALRGKMAEELERLSPARGPLRSVA